MDENEIKLGRYRHFKGNEYEVLHIAKHSEKLEPMVVYRALYGEGGVWVRPASMWNETVERDGKAYRRFTYIGESEQEPRYCKLEIFIPETHLDRLQQALQAVDAGHIGNYDHCLSYSRVTGCWRPLVGTAPYLGSVGEISAEPELKVEVTVRTERVDETVAAVKAVHPYEEPVINAIPLWRTSF